MIIGGLEKVSLIDYPGEISAIVFTQGCNFRCHFCYNPMLVWPNEVSELKYERDHSTIIMNDLFDFLRSRIGKLDGVVVTGGEPTLHHDLPLFLKQIKDLGYKVKLDSNGTNPKMLESVIESGLVDYLAMDIKAPLEKYEQVVGAKVDLENIKKSIKIIKESGLPYEFRTTVPPLLLNEADIRKMGQLIQGADKWYLQFFKSNTELVDRDFENKQAYTASDMEKLVKVAREYVVFCEARG